MLLSAGLEPVLASSGRPVAGAAPPFRELGMGSRDRSGPVAIPANHRSLGTRRVAAPASAPANLTLGGSETLAVTQNLVVTNLTIEDAASLTFGNPNWTATLTIEGNILLAGSGRLLLHDAYVDVEEGFANEYTLGAYGNSSLELNDVLWSSNGSEWSIAFYDASNLTVLDSNFEYPSSWADINVYGAATAWVDDSKLAADIGVMDSGSVPATARLTFADSVDFHLWLDFRDGASANLTLPTPDTDTTWSFPTHADSGIDYRIRLESAWPGLYSVLLYAGSHLNVTNSSDLIGAFLPENTSWNASGFREGEVAHFALASGPFNLTLQNVSVLSWSFYPVASSIELNDSDVGEAMGWTASSITLTDCQLTGSGGYYGVYDTSTMTIEGSVVSADVDAWDASTITILDSQLNGASGSEVEAVDSGQILLDNDTIGPGVSLAAQGAGSVTVLDPLSVAVSNASGPVAGASISAHWTANGTVAGSATAGPQGAATLPLPVERVDAAGTLGEGNYTVVARSDGAAASQSGELLGPASWELDLQALVLWTAPTNGSSDVGSNTTAEIGFGFAMDPGSVLLGLFLNGSPTGANLSWSSGDSLLTVAPGPHGWPASSGVRIVIGANATTSSGIPLGTPFELAFSTAPAPPTWPPQVLSIRPANGSRDVGLRTSIEVEFSEPMLAEPLLEGDFQVSPSVSESNLTVDGGNLTWAPLVDLAPSTLYTVTITGGAPDRAGVALGQSFQSTFSTVSALALIGSTPSNGSSLAGPVRSVQLNFSAPLSVAGGASGALPGFEVLPDVAGTLTVDGSQAIWTPAEPLEGPGAYVLGSPQGAQGLAGNSSSGPFWIDFTIEPQVPASTASPPAKVWSIAQIELAVGAAAALGALGAGVAVWLWARRSTSTKPPS